MLTVHTIALLILAGVLGAIIGIEREWNGKDAGIRTNAIVCIASAAFSLVAFAILEDHSNLDISRMIGSIISGVGFLGAGVVLKKNQEVHGLTTAAEIWLVASIGIAIGSGYPKFAVAITIVTLLFTVAFSPLSTYLKQRYENKNSVS